MNDAMTGAIAMGFAAAALFFLKFWRQSGDRLFAFFALSFFILSANRIGLVLFPSQQPTGNVLYWIRLAAFVLILVGILDKNRLRSGR